MHTSGPQRTSQSPQATTGDVDPNGDLVGEEKRPVPTVEEAFWEAWRLCEEKGRPDLQERMVDDLLGVLEQALRHERHSVRAELHTEEGASC